MHADNVVSDRSLVDLLMDIKRQIKKSRLLVVFLFMIKLIRFYGFHSQQEIDLRIQLVQEIYNNYVLDYEAITLNLGWLSWLGSVTINHKIQGLI